MWAEIAVDQMLNIWKISKVNLLLDNKYLLTIVVNF